MQKKKQNEMNRQGESVGAMIPNTVEKKRFVLVIVLKRQEVYHEAPYPGLLMMFYIQTIFPHQ